MTTGGARWVRDNRADALARIHAAGAVAVADAAEGLLEHANRTVPIEEGTLKGSGLVTADRTNARAAVSYDTPYAARQHEDMSLRHDSGRRAKWLELTWQERGRATFDFIADRLRAVT